MRKIQQMRNNLYCAFCEAMFQYDPDGHISRSHRGPVLCYSCHEKQEDAKILLWESLQAKMIMRNLQREEARQKKVELCFRTDHNSLSQVFRVCE